MSGRFRPTHNDGVSESNIRKVNAFRVRMGLLPIIVKERKCLNCDRVFKGYGNQERLCGNCKNRKELSN